MACCAEATSNQQQAENTCIGFSTPISETQSSKLQHPSYLSIQLPATLVRFRTICARSMMYKVLLDGHKTETSVGFRAVTHIRHVEHHLLYITGDASSFGAERYRRSTSGMLLPHETRRLFRADSRYRSKSSQHHNPHPAAPSYRFSARTS